MKQSVGQTYLIYFISIFILIVFAFLCGIMNYMKAFKVNSNIANALENYEGFNNFSRDRINNSLGSLGYRRGTSADENFCEDYLADGATFVNSPIINHEVCIGEISMGEDSNYFKYGITTFIYIDLPIISEIRIPIYSESEKIYDFSSSDEEVSEE